MNGWNNEITSISILTSFFSAISGCHSANDGSMAPPTQSTNQIASNSIAALCLRHACVIKTPDCQSKCTNPLVKLELLL